MLGDFSGSFMSFRFADSNQSSYTEAKELARLASSYVTSRGASDSLYTAYFKTNSVSTISSRFNAVANENSSSRTFVSFSHLSFT
jgi:hypothetical protein